MLLKSAAIKSHEISHVRVYARTHMFIATMVVEARIKYLADHDEIICCMLMLMFIQEH